uniref:WRKY domain-containing protein n=1 Tax=Opuntia streptacantha TaxID=393608 RepID=A0A7C9EXS3_OPUST
MEGSSLMDQKAVMIKELVRGIELAEQLRMRMLVSSTDNHVSSRDDDQALNHLLVDKMLSVFDKSISLAKVLSFTHELHQLHSESPHSQAHRSPGSEDSSHDLRLSKKRKKASPRIKWVRVDPGGSVSVPGAPPDDGYSWRKYGQKDILKAKHPRGYYRCTHRHTQGCFATKQVQKSNEDPSMYQLIYKGEHTCTQEAHWGQASRKPNQAQIEAQSQPQSQLVPTPLPQPQPQQQQCQMLDSNQQQGVNLGFGPDRSPTVEPKEKEDEAQIFSSLVQDCMLSSSPEFCRPAGSESNCFPVLPGRIMAFGPGLNVQTNEPMSGPSSASNSPNVGGFDFPFDMLQDIDVNFSFDCDNPLCHF